ncbi:MAG: hypothetical protein R6U68_07770 [Desulfobacteraceae bacterium]
MKIEGKKRAALAAAVFTYIKTEEEAACYAAQADAGPLLAEEDNLPGMDARANIWGSCGRSEMMQIKTMMQMRAFK